MDGSALCDFVPLCDSEIHSLCSSDEHLLRYPPSTLRGHRLDLLSPKPKGTGLFPEILCLWNDVPNACQCLLKTVNIKHEMFP